MGLPSGPVALSDAILGSDLAENDKRQDYLRSTLHVTETGATIATPFSRQDSSMMSRLAAAEALIVRAPFDPARKSGDPVRILSLQGGFVSI